MKHSDLVLLALAEGSLTIDFINGDVLQVEWDSSDPKFEPLNSIEKDEWQEWWTKFLRQAVEEFSDVE